MIIESYGIAKFLYRFQSQCSEASLRARIVNVLLDLPLRDCKPQ